jgi:hypothetical protein
VETVPLKNQRGHADPHRGTNYQKKYSMILYTEYENHVVNDNNSMYSGPTVQKHLALRRDGLVPVGTHRGKDTLFFVASCRKKCIGENEHNTVERPEPKTKKKA